MPKSSKKLADQRKELPNAPGVYVFRNRAGEALYVGKANSIRKRVASHFAGKGGGRGSGMGGTAELIDRTDSIEFLVTQNEPEALLAEQSFIKRYRPRFNIRLRDDKSYPYVGVSLDEDFPRVYFTRERHRPNRAYFGPFSSAKRVRETLDLLGKLFQYRTCEGAEPGRRSGVPCLDYYIKRCQAPCVGYIDREEYRGNIERIVAFLSGRYKEIAGDLEAKMEEASAAEDFERAALFRDRLNAVRSMMERQQVAGGSLGSADLIAVAVEGSDANAQVFQVRDGVLAERQGFYLAGEDEATDGDRDPGEVAETFLLQYYGAAPAVPGRVIVGPELKGRTSVLAEALSSQRDSQVEVRVGSRGDLRRLRELAEKNAKLALAQDKLRREHRRQQRVESLAALQEALGLERVPVRIEGFDISNLGETHTVASMVVFEGAAPKKSDYRKFGIRGDFDESNGDDPADQATEARQDAKRRTRRPDDFAAMQGGADAEARPLRAAGRHLAVRLRPRRELRRPAGPDRDRRRQGAALRGDEGSGAVHRARCRGGQPREADRGGLRPRSLRPDPAREGIGCPPDPPAGARRGTSLRDHLSSRAARQADDRLRARRRPGRRARSQAGAPAPLRLSRPVADGEPRGARGGARGAR